MKSNTHNAHINDTNATNKLHCICFSLFYVKYNNPFRRRARSFCASRRERVSFWRPLCPDWSGVLQCRAERDQAAADVIALDQGSNDAHLDVWSHVRSKFMQLDLLHSTKYDSKTKHKVKSKRTIKLCVHLHHDWIKASLLW